MADMHSSKAADDSIRPFTCQSPHLDRCILPHDFFTCSNEQINLKLGHTLCIVRIVAFQV